jgi:hypothetical protein
MMMHRRCLRRSAAMVKMDMDDDLINRERFLEYWLAEIFMDVDINHERAVESLRDDGLTLLDDPGRNVPEYNVNQKTFKTSAEMMIEIRKNILDLQADDA